MHVIIFYETVHKERIMIRRTVVFWLIVAGAFWLVSTTPSSSAGDFRTLFTSMRSGVDALYPENPIYIRVPANASGEPQYALPLLLPDSVEKDVFPDVERENPEKLSMLERLLAFGWIHKNAEEWWDLPHEEQKEWLMARDNAERRGFWVPKVDPVLEIARRWTLHYLKTEEKLSDTAALLENFKWGETLAESGAVMKQELLDLSLIHI